MCKQNIHYLSTCGGSWFSLVEKNMLSSTANLHKHAYCTSTIALKGIFQASLSPLFLNSNGNEIQVELDSKNLLNENFFYNFFLSLYSEVFQSVRYVNEVSQLCHNINKSSTHYLTIQTDSTFRAKALRRELMTNYIVTNSRRRAFARNVESVSFR